jgi:hypothetical protein
MQNVLALPFFQFLDRPRRREAAAGIRFSDFGKLFREEPQKSSPNQKLFRGTQGDPASLFETKRR